MFPSYLLCNKFPVSSKACLLNMTNDAFLLIFCMESSNDVLKSAQAVCNCVSLCAIFGSISATSLSNAHSGVCSFPLYFPCSVWNSTRLSWTGAPLWSVWMEMWETNSCIRMPWRLTRCSLHTNMCPGWPLMGYDFTPFSSIERSCMVKQQIEA